MNRKKIITVISILAILIIVGIGFLLPRLKNEQPQAHQKSPISHLAYCGPNDSKPCVVSFSVDADGNMLVNLITPKSAYPKFYLTINQDNIEKTYECRKVKKFPTNVYCTGEQMHPGETLQFNIISKKEDTVLAEGEIPIIGLLLPDPNADPTATDAPSATEPPAVVATEPPIVLEGLTPIPTKLTPSYPNPSYP